VLLQEHRDAALIGYKSFEDDQGVRMAGKPKAANKALRKAKKTLKKAKKAVKTLRRKARQSKKGKGANNPQN
jgi:hypothetical protein